MSIARRLLAALDAALTAFRSEEPEPMLMKIRLQVDTRDAETALERVRQLTQDCTAATRELADAMGDVGDFDVELDDELLAELARTDDDDHGLN